MPPTLTPPIRIPLSAPGSGRTATLCEEKAPALPSLHGMSRHSKTSAHLAADITYPPALVACGAGHHARHLTSATHTRRLLPAHPQPYPPPSLATLRPSATTGARDGPPRRLSRPRRCGGYALSPNRRFGALL
eukprot:6196031-Pleurochrysis_carterae.AAC.1